jgi:ATP-dependent DNA helicase DinG
MSSSAAKTLTVRQFFGRNGILSKTHPRYEHRPGQLDMAEAVASALADKRHLLVDAGTGTGKTLAYLVPAILSGKRVILHRYEKPPGTAFLQGHPISPKAFCKPASGLLHERPQQFRLSPENLRC